jgi:DNA-binding response OmpR family regulator
LRVLLVEDDKNVAFFVTKGLREEGFWVDHVTNGEDGFRLALHEPYDVALVDVMLPKLNGLSLIEEMRLSKVNTPVIILSAKSSVDDRVRGLQKGSDDYLTKPFAFSDLLARIRALIRRGTGTSELTCLTLGDLSMDILKREVTRSGKLIDLQAREFALLEFLMRNTGQVMSKTAIMEHVWSYNFDPSNVLEVHICRLREKIEGGFGKKLIHTIKGVGYVLREDQ